MEEISDSSRNVTTVVRPSPRPAVAEPWAGDEGDLPETPAAVALIRARLRAATTILTVAVGAFLARAILMRIGHAISAQIPTFLFLVGVLILLKSPKVLTLRQLRVLELATFVVMTAFLAIYQVWTVIDSSSWDRAHRIPSLMRSHVVYTIVLMLVYGMLIPNKWTRAAWIVIPMALGPPLVTAYLWHAVPSLRIEDSPAHAAFETEHISDDLLMLGVGVLLATYGTHLIHSLRAEVAEARRFRQYTLGARIAVGGMGEIYLAEHRFLKRPCVVKLIRPDRAVHERDLARFAREVRAMARLSHWNTVEVYDYGRTADGEFFYVMELLRGLNFADLVAKSGPLPPGRAIYLLRQACDALAEAHGAGMVHRDLKPANLFAARRGGRHDVTKILDFGLVAPVSMNMPLAAPLGDGLVVGSPHFMAPEQAAGGRRHDPREDLYAIGAVAYFLLTGRPPFEGVTAVRVMTAHTSEAVVPPSRHRPGLPADLERVVLCCLAKRPADRFPSAAALADALAACEAAADWDERQAAAWWVLHGDRAEESTPT